MKWVVSGVCVLLLAACKGEQTLLLDTHVPLAEPSLDVVDKPVRDAQQATEEAARRMLNAASRLKEAGSELLDSVRAEEAANEMLPEVSSPMPDTLGTAS